jgi:hypothetical protein
LEKPSLFLSPSSTLSLFLSLPLSPSHTHSLSFLPVPPTHHPYPKLAVPVLVPREFLPLVVKGYAVLWDYTPLVAEIATNP